MFLTAAAGHTHSSIRFFYLNGMKASAGIPSAELGKLPLTTQGVPVSPAPRRASARSSAVAAAASAANKTPTNTQLSNTTG